MPCTFPVGDVSGVLMSACASTQIRPTLRPLSRSACDTPDTEPTARLWSPPRVIGVEALATASYACFSSAWQTFSIAAAFLNFPLADGATFGTERSPASVTSRSRASSPSTKFARRMAAGPPDAPFFEAP